MTFKVSLFWSNGYLFIKILAAVIANKVIATVLGPSGIAIIGQFQNTSGIISSIAHGSIQTGTLKYVSNCKKDQNALREVISTSFCVTLILTLTASLFTLVFSENLGLGVFSSGRYGYIFKVFSASLIFYSLNIFLISILNGLGEIRLLAKVNIALSIIFLLSSSLFTIYYRLDGALLSLIATQVLGFLVALFLIYRKFGRNYFAEVFNFGDCNLRVTRNLVKFSISTFFSGFLVSVSMIIIRNMITSEMSLEKAGIWESGYRILIYYNMVFAVPFSIFYFPKFSKAKNMKEVSRMLIDSSKILTPLMGLLAFAIIMLKEYIIIGLFSERFVEIGRFLTCILAAEFLRIFGFFIQNTYMSQAKVFTISLFQLLFYTVFIICSFYSIERLGLVGVGYSYLVSSVVFLSFYLIYFYYRPPLRPSQDVSNE